MAELTPDQARTFARMVHAGAPPEEAAKYFLSPLVDREDLKVSASGWMQQESVQREYLALTGGKRFEDFDDRDQRRQYALDKHYDEMAFFLYSTNYAELAGTDKTKADTCREALEKKLAGLAGRDPLVEFWQDMLRTKKQETPADSDEVSLQ